MKAWKTMAAIGVLAAGLLLLSPLHVSLSPRDSFPHSLFPRSLAEVLGCPTPLAISLLENPPVTGRQVMLIVVSPDSVS